jgi:hypothetical protein
MEQKQISKRPEKEDRDLVVQEIDDSQELSSSMNLISMQKYINQQETQTRPQRKFKRTSDNVGRALQHQSSDTSIIGLQSNMTEKSLLRMSAVNLTNLSFNEGDSQANLLVDAKDHQNDTSNFDLKTENETSFIAPTKTQEFHLEHTFRPNPLEDSPRIEAWRVRARKNWAKARRILKTKQSYRIISELLIF